MNHCHISTPAIVNIKTDTTTFCFAGEFFITVRSVQLETSQLQRGVRYQFTQPRLREAQNRR